MIITLRPPTSVAPTPDGISNRKILVKWFNISNSRLINFKKYLKKLISLIRLYSLLDFFRVLSISKHLVEI